MPTPRVTAFEPNPLWQRAREPIFWLDPSLKLVWVNRAWEELTGHAASSVLGLTCQAHGPTRAGDPADLAASFHPPPEAMAGQPAGQPDADLPRRRRAALAPDRVLAVPRRARPAHRSAGDGAPDRRAAERPRFRGQPAPRRVAGDPAPASRVLRARQPDRIRPGPPSATRPGPTGRRVGGPRADRRRAGDREAPRRADHPSAGAGPPTATDRLRLRGPAGGDPRARAVRRLGPRRDRVGRAAASGGRGGRGCR